MLPEADCNPKHFFGAIFAKHFLAQFLGLQILDTAKQTLIFGSFESAVQKLY
jgi:hypothetical protein